MSQRDKTLKLANDTKSPSLMVKYRYLRNSITTLLRKAKQKYYHDGIINSSGNSKSMWKVLQSALNNTRHKNDISSDKADSFNEYFINVGCTNNDFFTDNQSEEAFNIKQCTEIFKFPIMPHNFVLNELRLLAENTNNDILSIDTKLLKYSYDIISLLLTKVSILMLRF